ncbi:glutathione transferase omega-1 [Cyathus striatus]|nr:glutathione transferase omega-1 [Cyathus striatus]
MNSYPPELLAQLAPVMFAAGLDAPQAPADPSGAPPSKPTDPFQLLSLRLREALLSQRKPAIWNPEKNKTFQVLLVDKNVQFPPRKLAPLEDPQYANSHSPLSPLTPSSPLHPDGLIAPIWIRKHTTLLPSVFVLFLRIFEFHQPQGKAPLDIPDTEREQEERRRDTEMAAEIALRKKATNDRGIKLTVVLMASRKMLDDPTLDNRLTYIRRQSGLDSRAALFVLSPVSASELSDFVRSLQQALYEPALEYYTSHSKRVRRKRNRHSTIAPHPPLGLTTNINIARPLRPEGWTVRYEYKMACFAEFRGEDEVALKHYQDAYASLALMFGSTAILPPRTKRWAEAKVLADCINIKIVKLYLYNNEHALALSHHNSHMRKFGDFSRGWGIGEETFEFWSWLARQHRVFAELLEQGTRNTLTIPIHKPSQVTSSSANANLASSQFLPPPVMGINPSHALQHPGFYYYMAAKCTEFRRVRFSAALEAELSHHPVTLSPGFTNEKKVDHLSLILELYTKAYELFKKYSPIGQDEQAQNQTQGRLTLWIAYRIADTYYDWGKFDMAVRFFERIAKTYRREKWDSMLRPLLSTWYSCAQQLGDVELSIKLLVEMLGHDAADDEDPSSLEDDLVAVLKSTVPASTDEPLVIDLPESQPIFDSNVVFWSSDVRVGERAAFQLSLTAPRHILVSSIPFSSLLVYFSDTDTPLVVKHTPSSEAPKPGHVQIADLRWGLGGMIVFSGTMESDVPTVLKIIKLVLRVSENSWKMEIPFHPCISRQPSTRSGQWLGSVYPPRFVPVKREEYSSAAVKHRPHSLSIDFIHKAPAYLDEDYPIVIQVTNTDNRPLEVVVDILLQPTEVDDAINSIRVDERRTMSFIKGVQFGLLAPDATASKTLHLINTGSAADRMLDFSVRSKIHEDEDEEDEEGEEQENEVQDVMEHLETIVVPTVEAFKVTQNVTYRRSLGEWAGQADLRTFNEDYWDDRRGGEALVSFKLECTGPSGVEVDKVGLEREDHENARVIDSSIDGDEGLASGYLPGDELGGFCRISLAQPDNGLSTNNPITGPGRFVVKWRRVLDDGGRGSLATSIFPLPSLQLLPEEVIALLDIPTTANLHVPATLQLILRNYHPTRSANITVQLETDSLDAFVIAGLRSGRVPVLLPGAEERLVWKIIPIECGYVRVPQIKVFDRRRVISTVHEQQPPTGPEAIGDAVKVIDLRRDQTAPFEKAGNEVVKEVDFVEPRSRSTVLVLP